MSDSLGSAEVRRKESLSAETLTYVQFLQQSFREDLLARDGRCLLTDVSHKRCTPAHILPQSRPEVSSKTSTSMQSADHSFFQPHQYYEEVMGYDPGAPSLPQFGILVASDLHHAFDRGQWALWPKVRCSTNPDCDAQP